MGNKAAKQYLMKKKLAKGKALSLGGHEDDLTDFLASLSDMAKKGTLSLDEACLPIRETLEGLSHQGEASSSRSTTLKDKRTRLQRKRAVSQDLGGRLELTPEQMAAVDNMMNQEDSGDWGEMREWLVWCMKANLQDEEETYPRTSGMANQSSLESNAET